MSITKDLVQASINLAVLDEKAEAALIIRNNLIYQAFVRGESQKDLAMLTGLGVSTIKHIISAQKL